MGHYQSRWAVQCQFRHSSILDGQTKAGKSSDVLPLGLRHEDVLQTRNLRLVLISQSLGTFATIEEVSVGHIVSYDSEYGLREGFRKSSPVLICKHVNAGRRPGRAIGQHLKTDRAWHVFYAPVLDLLSLLLGICNVLLQALMLLSSRCIVLVYWHVHEKAI